MARSRGEEGTPDRLAAVLEELEAVRRAPGWVPSQDSVVDEPRSKVADLPRRVAATRRAERTERAERTNGADSTRRGRHAAGVTSDEVRPREPLLRPPEPLLGAQVAPSRLAVIGALVLVSVAALVFGGRVLWARASAQPHPVTSTASAQGSAPRSTAGSTAAGSAAPAGAGNSARQGFGAAATPSSSASPTTLVVQVVGQVHKPGVVHVKQGSRVQDVVSAAGGALSSADLSAINLARVVSDGEQIQVPKPGEHPTPPPQGSPASSAVGGAGESGSAGGPASVVDLNTADQATLESLPGVGPVTAQRILQWRADNGRFSTVDELGEVSGIGDKTLAQLRPHVSVG
ncbi:helix-hairpin-helix domain-containing protein [Flexivirga sp. B27]